MNYVTPVLCSLPCACSKAQIKLVAAGSVVSSTPTSVLDSCWHDLDLSSQKEKESTFVHELWNLVSLRRARTVAMVCSSCQDMSQYYECSGTEAEVKEET